MLRMSRLLRGRIAWVHLAPNLVRLFSFVLHFPSLVFFPLNNIVLSKYGGRVVSMFSISTISLHTC